MVLQAYERLVALELGRSQVRVEHAGSIADGNVLQSITSALTAKYQPPRDRHRRAPIPP